MKLTILMVCTAVAFLIARSDAGAAKMAQISDNRTANSEAPGQGGFQSLQLTLRLSGDDLKNPTKCGDWKIESATDDLGTDLLDPQQAFIRHGSPTRGQRC